MDKLVILELEGDLKEIGFKVSLEVYAEVGHPQTMVKGYLPPSKKLLEQLENHWLKSYRSLETYYRIKQGKRISSRSLNNHIKKCRMSGFQLCDLFQNWLNTKYFSSANKKLREELSRKDNVRFVILTNDSIIQKPPWHSWDFLDRYPKAHLTFASLERESTTAKSRSFQFHPKVRILSILGHSDGIDIERDRQLLQNLPGAEVHFLVEPQHLAINDKLWDRQWDIIFFAGHSEIEGETGRIYHNSNDSLTVTELWYALRKTVKNGLKLAIFNSCDGLGLARQIKDLNIPQTIVMQDLAPDRVAYEFLKYFLTEFAIKEKPFHRAVRETRERLQGLESELPCASWLPVIYQNPTEIPLTWQNLLGAKKGLSPNKLISVLGKTMFSHFSALFKRPGIPDRLKREIHIYQGNYIENHDGGISHKHDSLSQENTWSLDKTGFDAIYKVVFCDDITTYSVVPPVCLNSKIIPIQAIIKNLDRPPMLTKDSTETLAIAALTKALGDTSPEVRSKSAESLSYIASNPQFDKIQHELIVNNLIQLLDDLDSTVRLTVVKALDTMGSDIPIPHLVTHLTDPDADVRIATAKTLAKLGKDKALHHLFSALGDVNATVRATAVKALGEFGVEDAIPHLVNTLSDRDPEVRLNSAEAIGKIGSRSF